MAVHQAEEYTSACGLADGGRNPAGCGVSLFFDIHTFILDEVLMSVNGETFNPASDPMRAFVGKREKEKISLHVCR
jgi:hypothetical protein